MLENVTTVLIVLSIFLILMLDNALSYSIYALSIALLIGLMIYKNRSTGRKYLWIFLS